MTGLVTPVNFDAQLKYDDCGGTYTDAYSGQSVSLEKGYNLILSKTFGLYQIPADAYRMEDSQFLGTARCCTTSPLTATPAFNGVFA